MTNCRPQHLHFRHCFPARKPFLTNCVPPQQGQVLFYTHKIKKLWTLVDLFYHYFWNTTEKLILNWINQPIPFTPHYSSSVCVNGTILLVAEGAPTYLTWTDLGTNTVVATSNTIYNWIANKLFAICG
jgi:hypothetical protein